MEQLKTIQIKGKLNEVFRCGEKGPGGAYHDYVVWHPGANFQTMIEFQKGSRNDPEARHGVLDADLLEIVRDRLQSFQEGEFACQENQHALLFVEEALKWMNERVENRIERGVLGTMEP